MRSSSMLAALALAALAAAAPAAAQRCTPARASDTTVVYVAQKIITMDPARPTATAVAVRGGAISAVGPADSVIQKVHGNCRLDNTFQNRVVLPGFVEAHTHVQMYGLFNQLPYAGYYARMLPDGGIRQGYTTWPAAKAYLSGIVAARRAMNDTSALYAYGTDPIFWGGRLTSVQLDSIASDIPILLQLGSGHIVVANSKMMDLIATTDPATYRSLVQAGYVVMNGNTPTGELDELAAVSYAINVLRPRAPGVFTLQALTAGIRDGAAMMQRMGITTATDLLFGVPGAAQTFAARALYAEESPRLPVRVALGYDGTQFTLNHPGDPGGDMKRARAMDTERLWTGPVKFILDGSIQGYTAELDAPYTAPVGAPNPIWNIPAANLSAAMQPYWNAGFSVTIHTNGDAATEQAIAAVRQLGAPTAAGQTASLQHNQAAHLDDYATMKSLGMMVNLFTPHIYYYGDQHLRYTLGPTRAPMMDNAHWADSLGIPFSMHSDAPVTVADPLLAAWAAVTRTTCGGQVLGASNAISVDRALNAITLGGATLLGRQSVIGSVQQGKWADFAVLDRDPSDPSGAALLTARVVATVVAGKVQTIENPSARTPQPACQAGPVS